MKLHPTSLALALAATIGGLSALPAHAALVTTASVSFNNSASVTDAEGGAATTTSDASLGSSAIQQFNASQGVLLGSTLNLSSTRTQTTTVTAAAGNSNGQASKSTSGTGSSTAALSAPGVATAFGEIVAGASCAGEQRNGCSGSSSATFNTNAAIAVSGSSLNPYVGAGTFTASRAATSLTAQQVGSEFQGLESTATSVAWAGGLSATYTYLLHAAPSFGGGALSLDLDFGAVFLGDAAPSLGFSIFNAAGDRVGLDLDGVEGTGDVARLYADLAGFSALAAGASQGFLATLDTSALGNFLTSYTLKLSDADVGAANSRFDYTMTLNLKGSVSARPQARVNDVPEPGMLALVSAGLLGLAMTRRRTRRG